MISARIGSSGASTTAGGNHQHNSYGHGHASIPAAAKKVVQSLKEIVKNHTEDEIYDTLKECNMDPNDAVHKLMNQDTFHEVKRRREKKKENGINKDFGEPRLRSFSGSVLQGGGRVLDRGGTRLNYVPRRNYSDNGGGGHQFASARENGVSQSSAVASTPSSMQSQSQAHSRSNLVRGSHTAPSSSLSSGIVNGRLPYTRGVQARGNWTKVTKPTTVQSLISSDPKKHEVLALENHEKHGNKFQGGGGSTISRPDHSAVSKLDSTVMIMEGKSLKVSDTVGVQVAYTGNISEEQKKYSTGIAGTRAALNSYQSRAYQSQQQPIGSRASSGLEWKPKSPSTHVVGNQASHEMTSADETAGSLQKVSSTVIKEQMPASSLKIEGLSLQDKRPVIIPDYLQVPEAECAGLSFGSFDLEISVTTVVSPEENKLDTCEDVAMVVSSGENVPEQPIVSSVTEPEPASIQPDESQGTKATAVETLVTSNDTVLNRQFVSVTQPEISKPEPVAQPSRQLFLPALPSYHGFGLVPQPQYSYEATETQSQEASRLPSSFMSFSDPGTSYFSPVFRPGSDADTRYQFVPTNLTSKFSSNNATLMSGQSLSSSQELSQTPTVTHTTSLAMAQPPYAYAQPAGLTISPYPTNIFGYQFVPPRYAYMHTPYQHNYTGNIGYPQAPGSTYASGARGYPPVGSVKYPPQFKPGTAVGNAPHAVVPSGYGSFGASGPGFATITPAVTTGSASGYDDMVGQQYKENTYYTPNQQGEGSAVWIHTPLSRDVPGMQTNSYYNLQNQGQHAGYAHTQPSHAHPATGYASYYHLSQSASGPNTHQLLQQPQALGSAGTASQAVIYQPSQHGQLTWPSNYTNLIRSQ